MRCSSVVLLCVPGCTWVSPVVGTSAGVALSRPMGGGPVGSAGIYFAVGLAVSYEWPALSLSSVVRTRPRPDAHGPSTSLFLCMMCGAYSCYRVVHCLAVLVRSLLGLCWTARRQDRRSC